MTNMHHAETANFVDSEELKSEQLLQMIDSVPVNLMFCDRLGTIKFMNRASREILGRLTKYLPIPVEKMVGSSFDVFHKNPSHQRHIIADHHNLPHRATIQLGPEYMSLLVTAIMDSNGEYTGPMLTWELVTDKVAREKADADRLLSDKKLAEELRGNADLLTKAADEFARVSQELSAGAEETSAQADVVSRASNQVHDNIQTVASSAEEMTASISEISQNTTQALKVANQAVEMAVSANETVTKLNESSNKIGKVVKVITLIAAQTNLLALNATIEAARAGTAGRGFAVVANEVKELAKETAKATGDIGQTIEAIQVDTRSAISAIEQISNIIKQISDIQGTISAAIEEQSATTREISRSVNDAAQGASEIAQNITGVAAAAQETSKGSIQTQEGASALTRMAAELQKLVQKFSI